MGFLFLYPKEQGGERGACVFKSSKMFCFTLFAWLRLSGLSLTLYLNSVYHGSRTELQPRWLCHNPSITFTSVFSIAEFVRTLSLSLRPFWVSSICILHVPGVLCAWHWKWKSHQHPSPSLPTACVIHPFAAHLPAFWGPQYGPYPPLSRSMLPAWLYI